MPNFTLQCMLLIFVPTLRIGSNNNSQSSLGMVQAFSMGTKRPMSFRRYNELKYGCFVEECDESFINTPSSSALSMTLVELPSVNFPYPYEDMKIEIKPPSPEVVRIGNEIEVLHTSSKKNEVSNLFSSATKVKTKKSSKGIKVKKRMIRSSKPALSIPSYNVNRRSSKRSNGKSFLTREEESKLTFAIRSLRKAVRIRDDLSIPDENENLINLPSELEWAEACGVTVNKLRRIMISGHEARSILVAKNVGLVVQIAQRYHLSKRSSNLTLQDMIQEGNLGLMKAAERFDPARGFKFSTYAAYWVRQRIMKSIADHSRLIRLPVHVHTMVGKIEKARKEMAEKIGRTPSDPELAHELGIPMDKLKMYIESSRTVLSLEKQLYTNNFNAKENSKMTLSDKISCNLPTPEDDAQENHLRQDIRAVMDQLNSNEREIVTLRFGLEFGSANTLDQIASRMNLSREQVRLLEARAINKLRHPGRNYKLKDYVEAQNCPEVYNDEVLPGRTPEQIWSF